MNEWNEILEVGQTIKELPFKQKNIVTVSTVSVSQFSFSVSIKMSRRSFCFIHVGKEWYFIVTSNFLKAQMAVYQKKNKCMSKCFSKKIEISGRDRVSSCIMQPSGLEFYSQENLGCWRILYGSDGHVSTKYSISTLSACKSVSYYLCGIEVLANMLRTRVIPNRWRGNIYTRERINSATKFVR